MPAERIEQWMRDAANAIVRMMLEPEATTRETLQEYVAGIIQHHAPAAGADAEIPGSFHVIWRKGAYYVSIPQYDGGEVVPVAHVRELVEAARGVALFPHDTGCKFDGRPVECTCGLTRLRVALRSFPTPATKGDDHA